MANLNYKLAMQVSSQLQKTAGRSLEEDIRICKEKTLKDISYGDPNAKYTDKEIFDDMGFDDLLSNMPGVHTIVDSSSDQDLLAAIDRMGGTVKLEYFNPIKGGECTYYKLSRAPGAKLTDNIFDSSSDQDLLAKISTGSGIIYIGKPKYDLDEVSLVNVTNSSNAVEYAEAHNWKDIPFNVVKHILSDDFECDRYFRNVKIIPSEVMNLILKKQYLISNYVSEFLKFKNIPQNIMDLLTASAAKAYDYAWDLNEANKNIPDNIINVIATSPAYSYYYASVISGFKNVPAIIEQAILNSRFQQEYLTKVK